MDRKAVAAVSGKANRSVSEHDQAARRPVAEFFYTPTDYWRGSGTQY